MKTAILYHSIWGTTKQYAEWLHEEIESDIFKHGMISKQSLLSYDLIIMCTATYGGRISLKDNLKKKWDILKSKKVILLVVGSVPADEESSIKSYEKIPEQIRERIKYFKIIGKKFGYQNADKIKKENLTPVIEYIKSI